MNDNHDMFGADENLDDHAVLAHMDAPRTKRWEGTLRDMRDTVIAVLKKSMDATEAQRCADRVVFRLCDTVGGQVCYLPRGAAVRTALRDARIFEQWSHCHMTPNDLARKHHLAVQTVYDIIARQRAIRRRQSPDLFGYPESP